MDHFSSKLLEQAVLEFSSLPGVGKRTALRLVLHLLKQDVQKVRSFSDSILQLKLKGKLCRVCHNLSDADLCEICSNPHRDKRILCVVEDIRDVMALENTRQFKGVYHILGGKISPMEGIGPSELNLESLLSRVAEGGIEEVILALSPTTEGETTNFYLYKKLGAYLNNVSTIARGVSFGDELEYADEVTLGRSILNRVPYKVGNS